MTVAFFILAHAALVVHVNLTLREILKKNVAHRLLEKIVKKYNEKVTLIVI
jgi:hypothetical protein